MLRLHFINVADGDAILAELYSEEENNYCAHGFTDAGGVCLSGMPAWKDAATGSGMHGIPCGDPCTSRGCAGEDAVTGYGPCMMPSSEPCFRMLIDAGRPDIGSMPGSMRCTAADYLSRRGITGVDVLVVTHLHIDHFAGLELMLPGTRLNELLPDGRFAWTKEIETHGWERGLKAGVVYSGYFPGQSTEDLQPEPGDERTLVGQAECLRRWNQCAEKLRQGGSDLRTVDISIKDMELAPGLKADIIASEVSDEYNVCGTGEGEPRNSTGCARQHRIWDDMIAGLKVTYEDRYWASKLRNPGSLRVRLRYGGRSIELSGDCYGGCWDSGELEHCDIFKVPHHGDRKSLTASLVEHLRPVHAVISCGGEYNPTKERPSEHVIKLLRDSGARVWFTDCFTLPGEESHAWDAAVFDIYENGTIMEPGRGHEMERR